MLVKQGLTVQEFKTKDARGKVKTEKVSNLTQNIDLSRVDLKKYQDK